MLELGTTLGKGFRRSTCSFSLGEVVGLIVLSVVEVEVVGLILLSVVGVVPVVEESDLGFGSVVVGVSVFSSVLPSPGVIGVDEELSNSVELVLIDGSGVSTSVAGLVDGLVEPVAGLGDLVEPVTGLGEFVVSLRSSLEPVGADPGEF